MKMTSQPIQRRLALIPALLLALIHALLCTDDLHAANTHAATLVRSSSQYFSAPDSPSLSITGDLTVEAWIKLASQPTTGSYTIVSKSSEGGNQASFGLRYLEEGGGKKLDAWISANGVGGPHASVAKTIASGEWTHIAMAYSASAGSITFYVNGIQAGATQTGLPNSIYDGNASLLISGYDTGVLSTLLNGQIDDVRLWSTARTQGQIQAEMFRELAGTEFNLRGYWKLNNSLADNSPNGNSLLNNNGATFESSDLPFKDLSAIDSWLPRTSGTTASLRGIDFGNGTYVATGAGGTVLTSPDGTNWTARSSGSSVSLGVAFGNNVFVAVGLGGTILTSSNGIIWSPQIAGTPADLNDVYFVNGQFIVLGYMATILTSSNGVNWTIRDSGVVNTNSSQGILYRVDFGNGIYVISGGSGTILKSPDLTNWTQQTIGPTSLSVTFGNGIFVANGHISFTSSSLLTSSDGNVWATQTPVQIQQFVPAFAGGNFVGVGGDMLHGTPGYIWASSNGTNWTSRKSDVGVNLAKVKFVNYTFIAVGESGTILQSGPLAVPPEIVQQPTNQGVPPGGTMNFTVDATGSPTLLYQWRFAGTNLLDQTNSTLTLTNASPSQQGLYSVIVSNSYGFIVSSNALLTVYDVNDDDYDGIPNYWELLYALIPTNPNDANTKPPGDQLTYLQKYLFGLDPTTLDNDGDGLTDYDELFLYSTNPLLTDTDGDGMPDNWEVQHGLNPRFNDAADDLDMDGISNLAEYNWNLSHPAQLLDPRKKYSTSTTLSDYALITGFGTNQFFYDRNNRLIGAELDRGLALAYVYDGNDNLTRQVSMKHDANTNGLPDLWEFLNGLTNNTSAFSDTDGDGWSDWQEWKAGTSPTSVLSSPNLLGNPGTNIASLTLPFTPSNFVVGVGQLDGGGAEEIVLGADGNPGSTTNFLLVLTQGATTWSTQRVDVGSFGITSIAVGRLTNRPSAGIYVGLRGTTSGRGRVLEFTSSGGNWQSNVIALSTNQTAFVLGVRGPDVLVSLATINVPDGSLSAVSFTTNWNLSLMDTNSSHRGLGTAANFGTTQTSLRLLDTSGIQIGPAGYSSFMQTNIIYRSDNGMYYLLTPSDMTWTNAENYAKSLGGHLATVTSSELNSWLRANFAPSYWIGLFSPPGYNNLDPINGWIWVSGTNSSFRSWDLGGGQPNGGAERFAMVASSGGWHDQPAAAVGVGLIETAMDLSVFNVSTVRIPEPTAVRTNNWRGNSLASGFLRGTNGSSILYTFTDDKNANSLIDFGDDFVTTEYLVNGTNASLLTLSRQPIAALTPAQSYGLASVNFLNATNEVFFTGEPDGNVFAWTATGATNPLQRQLFSGHHVGKAWHALSGVKTFEPGEALIGLRVDPTNQNRCDLILWPPQSQLPQLASLPNTAPAAAVLPSASTLGGQAAVTVRLWDAEGNAATPFLQYQISGQTNWHAATLALLDGLPYSIATRVATSPGGVNHTVVWNALADLGSNVVTNVLVRACASDLTLLGDWSLGTPFQVNTVFSGNIGNEPTFGSAQRLSDGQFQLSVTGGVLGQSYVILASTNLADWIPISGYIFTNPPVTIFDPDAPSFRWRFYRIGPLTSVPAMNLGLPFAQTFSSNGLNLALFSLPGFNYRIEASTNLVNWIMITNFTSTSSTFLFNDPAATNFSRRFYRAVGP